MMWSTTFAIPLLLAAQVSAGLLNDVSVVLRRDNTQMEVVARGFADALAGGMEKRQATTIQPTANNSIWDATTQVACTAKLSQLNGVASNAAGFAACYNIASLNKVTGVFQADLRLYMIAVATGDFLGVPAQNVIAAVDYRSSANVSMISESALQARSEKFGMESWPSIRNVGNMKRLLAPALVQSYAFLGQLDVAKITANMDE